MARIAANAVELLALLVAVAAAAQLPGPPARPPENPAVLDARDFGARPGTDCTAALQKALDACAAPSNTGHTLRIRGADQPYLVSAPLRVTGRRVNVVGDGPATALQAAPGYGGPVVAVGLPDLPPEATARCRPDLFGVLDASLAPRPGVARGFATGGETTLVFQGHPLQLGAVSPTAMGHTPDYYTESPVLTLDVAFAMPFERRAPGQGLLGAFDGTRPQPVAVHFRSDDAGQLALHFRTADLGGGHYTAFLPLDAPGLDAGGTARVAFTVNLTDGTVWGWLNGGPARPLRVYAPDASPFGPGKSFAPQDGATPWIFGTTGSVPNNGQPATDVSFYGFRLQRGEVYSRTAPRQERLDEPGVPANDHGRFRRFNEQPLDRVTVCCWDLTDSPSPYLAAWVLGDRTLGFLVPNRRDTAAESVTLRDLEVRGVVQPGILLGQHLGVKLQSVRSVYALQGVGGLSLVANYPVRLEGCSLSGGDCAYFGFRQILTASDTTIEACGREAIRVVGGGGCWDHTFVRALPGNSRRVVEVVPDSAILLRLTDFRIDDEGPGPSEAVVHVTQCYAAPGQVAIDGLYFAGLPPSASAVKLVGVSAPGGAWRPMAVDARNILTDGFGSYKAALEVVGPACWRGTFDASGLPLAAVEGGASAAGILPGPGPAPAPSARK